MIMRKLFVAFLVFQFVVLSAQKSEEKEINDLLQPAFCSEDVTDPGNSPARDYSFIYEGFLNRPRYDL